MKQGAWIGANFWSRAGGPRMWVEYDPALVRDELATLVANGMTVTRSFCYWPDFVPLSGQLDAKVAQHFADFLDAHTDAGLGTIPTFLVGHMSGENWDPSWRGGRDLYRDVSLVSEEAWFANEVARRFAGHPAIVGWLISNEMPIYGGPAEIPEINAWARILVQAVRAGGGHQPISIGDGAWGIEATGSDNGYSMRELEPLIDFAGPHVYPATDDALRMNFSAALACEMSATFDRPVVLEEFGLSSDFASDLNGAHYYRQVLHSSLLAGAEGWLAWNNTDFDGLADRDPYRHHPFELHFGLTDSTGKAKPQMAEMARFARLIRSFGEAEWHRVAGDAVVVIPEHFERELPGVPASYRSDLRDNLYQGYLAAREADLPVRFMRERDGLQAGAKLYLLPSTKVITAPTARRLVELAEAGATIYLSYFAGSDGYQRGPWVPWLGEIFGVRQQLSYGLIDSIAGDAVMLQMVQPLGDLETGERLTFPVAGTFSARAFLPVEAADAEVLALDDQGRPALLRRRVGAGSLVLGTYPVEHFAARTPWVNPESTWRLYAGLAGDAGVDRPITVNDPRVVVGRIKTGEGEVALAINTSSEVVTAAVETTGDTAYGTDGGAERTEISLPPFEVEVLHRLR